MKKILRIFFVAIGALALSACSTTGGFVIKSVYEESKILLARKTISRVIEDPNTPQEEREKLEVVQNARVFAQTMGLKPGESFTKYTRVDRDVLLWVVAGSKPDAFELHTWWFPFVGRVPYKGFFEKDDAIKEGQRLKSQGYEVYIRGSDAFSTLGWFNDPVLSTTLQHSKSDIANTVIHESVHRTVWIPDHVPFNETLANFVGFQGSVDFFSISDAYSKDPNLLHEAVTSMDREMAIASVIDNLYTELDALYKGSSSREEKLAKRAEIFNREVAPLKARFPELKILSEINNAELMQLRFYMTKLDKFQSLWVACDRKWECFLGKIRSVKEAAEKGPEKDPFKLLDRELEEDLEKTALPG